MTRGGWPRAASPSGAPEQPHIPASVTFAETLLQLPMSAALIFLFLLAVKNSYKIK